ncbi:MAG: TolC family protein [Bacteroidia bacterium]|nr:TolC family protein [Bacteroidia bacterium]
MKHLKTYALILSLVGILYNTQAQEANKTSFSLSEAIEYSLKHSPNYLNAELDQKSAEYRRKEVTGLGLPQVNGSIDIKDYINIPTSLLPAQIFGGPEGSFIPVKFGTKYNATAGLSASQLIFSSDYIYALKGSKVYNEISKISVTRSKNELAAQVTKAYYSLAVTKDRLKTSEANVIRTKVIYDNTKASNEQGLAELIDVERTEVDYNNALLDRDLAVRNLANIEAALKFQMGYKIEDVLTITDSVVVADEQELNPKADFTNRPEYQLAQKNQTFLDMDVKRLKWGYLPTLSAYGSYQFNAQRNEFNFANDKNDPSKQWFKVFVVGATLNVNIFDGLQRHYKIQQAKVSSLKNQNNIRMIELAAQLDIQQLAINYNIVLQNYKNQKRNLELATHVYESAKKKYESGVGSNLEVVSAQAQVMASQANYYNVLYNLVSSKTDYLKATGTLVK